MTWTPTRSGPTAPLSAELARVNNASDGGPPISDRTDLDRFHVAIGTSGNQFRNGGPVGYLMAKAAGPTPDRQLH